MKCGALSSNELHALLGDVVDLNQRSFAASLSKDQVVFVQRGACASLTRL